MKSMLVILLALIASLGYSQNNNILLNNRENTVFANGLPTLGISMHIVNPTRQSDGSVYLFDRWDNNIIIVTDQGDKMRLDNINLNVDRSVFETRFGGDSLFSFNFNNIDKFVINNKAYKNFFWKDDNRVYEVLAETKDFSVLKGFRVKFIEGSHDPMLNRSRDRYIISENYYIKRENSIKQFSLRKGSILKLFAEDKAKKKAIINYVDEKNLSYTDESHIDDIISYAISI